MPQFEKHFTLEEARALLPAVRDLLQRVHRLLCEPILIEMDLEEMRPVHPMAERALSFSHEGPTAPDLALSQYLLPQTVEGRQDQANQILISLVDKGIVVQDVRRGLIDFPHLLHGKREVLLCYELADGERLGWYHDLHAGFVGRQPIPEDA